jgi:conjugative transfer pilus assembly protein TraH
MNRRSLWIKKGLLGVALVFILNPAWAGIETHLKEFFDAQGTQVHLNNPGAYQDQSAGYYTGGSFMLRNTVKHAQLATLQMPGYRAGCGGIDAWAGGLSHISGAEIMNTLRNIGGNMQSYAFLLMVETLSPQIYNIMNELNALATKVNNLNISSCEAAATMLGGLWPKTDQSSKHLCQAMGTNLGSFSDWSQARQGCGPKGDRAKVFREKGGDPKYKDMLFGEFNLTWKALKLNPFLSKDKDNSNQLLNRLFMTLVGSIISTQEGESYVPRVLPGHAQEEKVLQGLLNGGPTPVYECDSEHCLNPKLKDITIPEKDGLFRKVHTTLEKLVDKIYKDEAIDEAEQVFLNTVQLPVYKMLNVTTAYRLGAAPLNIHQYSDLIALDLLYGYVLEVMDFVYKRIDHLNAIQVDEGTIKPFLEQLSQARQAIMLKRSNAFQHMDTILSFVESIQLIEKQLHVMLGNVANEYNGY